MFEIKNLKQVQNKGLGFELEDFGRYLYGFLYFALCRKNLYIDQIRYRISEARKNDIVTVNDSQMKIDFSDVGICMELSNHKKREFFSTEFMKQFVSDHEIIVDIGANIGYYALLESKLANKGFVFAIEPVPSNKNRLDLNIKLNGVQNVSTYQFAIGDKTGTSKMFVYAKCNWCSFNKVDAKVMDEIDVKVITLHQFIEQFTHIDPTFVRMDLEGYEYEVIKSTDFLKNDKLSKLYIELHPHLIGKEKFEEILSILKDNNFKINKIFLEPETHNYRDIKLINILRRAIGLTEYGYVGNKYEDMKSSFAYNVFFER